MKFDYKFLKGLTLALALMWGAAAGADEESDKERIQVGTRACSHSEWVETQEERAKQEEESKGEDNKGLLSKKTSPSAGVNYISHPGAFYSPIYVSALGDKVELNDGSIWSVSSSDTFKTFNWLTSDLVILTPNHEWFSSYMFKMTNQNTGVSIKCNLTLGPIYNGLYTHWITAINYYTQEIALEDGSIWKVTGFDSSVFSKWLVNDTIIIGVNDGFLSSSKPNILINVNTLTYVRSDCTWQ